MADPERLDPKRCSADRGPVARYLLALVLFLTALHSPVLVGRYVYFHDDLSSWFMPVHQYMREQLWQGIRLPWCPLDGCGYPLSADPQTGVFYPLNLILVIPLPIGQVMGWLIWLHYFIAGAGAFRLARLLRQSSLAALAAGVIYSSTGFMVAHLHHTAIVTSAAWLPWAWYGLLRYRMDGGIRWLLLVIWCSAAQLLAGQPQVWLLTVASGFIFVGLGEAYLRSGAACLRRHQAGRRWLILACGVALGAGVAAVTLLPAVSLLRLSGRSESSLAFATSYGLCRPVLTSFLGIRPATGDRWEYEGFAGLSALLLMALAMWRGRPNSLVRMLYVLLIVALAMGLSSLNPLYRLLVHVPLLSGMRCAARWLVVISLCLSLLAACGLDVLAGWRRWAAWSAATVLACEAFWFATTYNPRAPAECLKPPAVLHHLGPGRIMAVLPAGRSVPESAEERFTLRRQLLLPNLNMLWGVPSAQSYMPFLELRDHRLLVARSDWVASPDQAARCGIRWLLAKPETRLASTGWVLRYTSPDVAVYENVAATPTLVSITDGAPGDATLLAVSGRGLSARCDLPSPTTVVFAVMWLPWWQATVDGREVEVMRTRDGFCALRAPAGASTVELRYSQPLGREGALISGVCVLLTIALIAAARRWTR